MFVVLHKSVKDIENIDLACFVAFCVSEASAAVDSMDFPDLGKEEAAGELGSTRETFCGSSQVKVLTGQKGSA